MGVENIPKITQKLIENGRSADTPAAVIRWGTHPEQQTLVTTVGTAAADVARRRAEAACHFYCRQCGKTA